MSKPKRRRDVAAVDGVRAQFAGRMRQLREERGLTQGEMAVACGLSKVYYGVLELGKKSASLETLDQIAGHLRMSLSDLLRLDASDDATKRTPAERLGQRITAMAAGASDAQISRLERVARILLEAEPAGTGTKQKPGR